jgi:hypothetical protein
VTSAATTEAATATVTAAAAEWALRAAATVTATAAEWALRAAATTEAAATAARRVQGRKDRG